MCAEKPVCHTVTGKEKQSEFETAIETQIFLWQPQKIFHHIKRKNKKPSPNTKILL
jgi:hypothetical protein